jgi:hypothetical protein
VSLPDRLTDRAPGVANLPLALDVVQAAIASGQNYASQVAQGLAGAFGRFAAWRLLHELQDAGIVAVLSNRRVCWTDLGRRFHRDIESIVATVEGLEGRA